MVNLSVNKKTKQLPVLDLAAYTDRYPYRIDRNQNIYANNDLYMNASKQIVNILQDQIKIMKLYRQNPGFMGNINQMFFTK